jgi:hypothetical protein
MRATRSILLSVQKGKHHTDWFFDHWAAIGISVDKVTKPKLQSGCRVITKHILFVNGQQVEEYYHVSFLPDRVMSTRKALIGLLDDCAIQPIVKNDILFALNSKKYRSPATHDLFEEITDLLVARRLDDTKPLLDKNIGAAVVELQRKSEKIRLITNA